MNTQELLRLVASQSEVRETARVKVWGPSLRAAVESGRLTELAKIIGHPDQTTELRTFRYGHLVGKGLSVAEIEQWQVRFPRHPLPADLVELLQHANGVHFWADLDRGRAYYGIAPLNEWKDASDSSAPSLFDRPSGSELVISYHENGDSYVARDTASQQYVWIDHEDIGSPVAIGSRVSELLDWLWRESKRSRPMMNRNG